MIVKVGATLPYSRAPAALDCNRRHGGHRKIPVRNLAFLCQGISSRKNSRLESAAWVIHKNLAGHCGGTPLLLCLQSGQHSATWDAASHLCKVIESRKNILGQLLSKPKKT